jgi:hypothetical protein
VLRFAVWVVFVAILAGCGGGGISASRTGLCPSKFKEQHMDVTGTVADISPLGGGVYLILMKDDAALPCEVVTHDRPASNAHVTLKSLIAHRNDKATTTEFLYPESDPTLASFGEAGWAPPTP